MADVNSVSRTAVPTADELIVGSDGEWTLVDVVNPTLVSTRSGEYMSAGWYLLAIDELTPTGDLVEPALYPDYGDGFWEQERIPLKQLQTADARALRGVICLSRPARAVRFNPSLWSQTKFSGVLRLRRISRIRACLAMMRFTDRTPWRAPLSRRIGHAFLIWMRQGAHGLGHWLYKNEIYRQTSSESQVSYRDWLKRFDDRVVAPVPMDGSIDRLPDFSFLLPVFNTPASWLQACVESVLAQSYDKWQLCIADDASASPETIAALAKIENLDSRIVIIRRPENGHISAASNSALELATCEFVVLLDHDDVLHPDALAEFATAICRHQDWDLVYSDEDKIDESGRSDPYFKPDFDLDLLRGHNCISHLSAYRRKEVEAIGGFQIGLEGSQDWDLSLRFIERVGVGQVGHIPRVLYHWRKSEQSTAFSASAKSYASVAALRAINEHLQRTIPGAIAAEISGNPGNYRTFFPLPDLMPLVSIAIPTRDNPEMLLRCVRSVVETSPLFDLELLIMDNGSVSTASMLMFERLSNEYGAKVFRDESAFNYSALNNKLAARASGEIILFLNDDIEAVRVGWLDEMISLALRADVGAVGAKLFYPDGRIQHAGIVLGLDGVAANALRGRPGADPGMMNRSRLLQGLSAVTGACLAIRRSVFEDIGGFDEELEVMFNDVDLCLRLRAAAMLVLWTPFAELLHHESVSRGIDSSPQALARARREEQLMRKRWGHWIECDPAYNPNLSIVGESYTLAMPPRRDDSAQTS